MREPVLGPAEPDPRDNALARALILSLSKDFSTLEAELLARRRFQSQAEARMACFSYIEGWYNPHRRHSGLGYLSPVAFERSMTASAAAPETPSTLLRC